MLARTTLTLAALALARLASAQEPNEPYSPSQMTWGPPIQRGPAAEPVAVSSESSGSSRAAELSGGLYLGRLAGENEAAGGLELGLAAAFRRFTVGGRLFTMGSSRGGLGAAVTAGPRFPLGPASRIDLVLDAGVLRHTGYRTPRPLAELGARLGLGLGRQPGTSVSFGALAQFAQKTTTGGGTVLGLYLAVGHLFGERGAAGD